MAGFKLPDFKERAALSLAAKQQALEKMKAKPPIDPAEIERRQAVEAKRDDAAAEKRRVKEAAARAIEEAKAAEEAAKAEVERLAAEEAEAARKAKLVAMPTQADLKAARDARYAARKAKK